MQLASGLVFGACNAGAAIFNAVSVEDVVFHQDRVAGLIINWAPVHRLGMHVDPLVVTARAVLDSTGHPAEVVAMAWGHDRHTDGRGHGRAADVDGARRDIHR